MSETKNTPGGILAEIVARTKGDIEIRKRDVAEELLWRHARSMPLPPSFADSLRRLDKNAPPKIIAELKKASPSKGLIRKNFRVISLARELAEAGASALSVLTEPHYFQGHIRNLRMAADNVSIPVLRKDFIIDPYQIVEARINGASAVLLIAASLDHARLKELWQTAREVKLDVLLEVHTCEELESVLEMEPEIIGVNCRNLRTFETDLSTTADLISRIPRGIVKAGESGILSVADFREVAGLDVDCCLIGEYFMRAAAPGDALRKLIG